MLKNYFLVAVRHLKRQPGYAALNIIGLTIGIASALLILLYLQQELSFDSYHVNADRVYRVSSDISEPDNSFRWAVTQAPLGKTINAEYPEIINYTRFAGVGDTRVRKGEENYLIERMYLVDSTVFDLFTFDFIQGHPASSLDAPNSVVLSESTAKRIFKGSDPMGQMLETENFSYKVTGIFKDMPNTSHIIADAMVSFSTNERYSNSQSWGGFGLYTYVLLDDKADPKVLEKKLNDEIIEKYVATIFDQFDIEIVYELINMRDIHLYSDFEGEPVPLGNIDYIYIFSAVALFLVLIACINYMNLATARSMRRSLEVGIRKVMGAIQASLMRQFIVESILVALIAIILSILIVLLVIPSFNNFLGTHLEMNALWSAKILWILVAILIFTGVISGSYPAFYLSRFNPVQAIKGGKGSSRTGNVWLRRVLVGLQFSISLFMLMGTVIIYQQMQYVREADMGFNKNQVIHFGMNRNIREKWPAMRNRLMENPLITNASTSSTVPGQGFGKNVMMVETNEGVMESYGIDSYAIDYDYLDVLEIDIKDGRNISRSFSADTITSVLVNEAMVTRMGWTEPIGKKFQFDQDSTVFHRVVGVVSNFNQQSLYNPIEALLFIPDINNSQAMVKIGGDYKNGIAHVQQVWQEFFPNLPFEYQLLDQYFLEAYEEDQLRGQLFLGFALMMIIISGLGLLGLASFTAEQRTKEISIRKVLGANVSGLIVLLVKDFVWLVLIGALPAFLIGYKIMNDWLGGFEYHIEIGIIAFVLVLVLVMAFVITTTGLQAYKAAIINPAEKLKYE